MIGIAFPIGMTNSNRGRRRKAGLKKTLGFVFDGTGPVTLYNSIESDRYVRPHAGMRQE
jgi:hypothetical protein